MIADAAGLGADVEDGDDVGVVAQARTGRLGVVVAECATTHVAERTSRPCDPARGFGAR
jgi:hypothetical protein